MFTGIITEVGRISALQKTSGGVRLTIEAPQSAGELAIGHSVAVTGVCLTVTAKVGRTFVAEAVEETLKKTTLGRLRVESRVNLELPMRLDGRLGGHLVLGHVDCTGVVSGVVEQASSRLISITYPPAFQRYLIPVGSVAVDGISLTVAALREGELTVSIIPHTLEHTTLAGVAAGSVVNLEFDLIGKYVESLMGGRKAESEELTWDRLREWGYKS
jgi:riboflavin synthase